MLRLRPVTSALSWRRPVALGTGLVLMAGATAAVAGTLVGGAGLVAKKASDTFLALPATMRLTTPPERSELLASDGTPFAYLWSVNRHNVPLSQVSTHMREAIVAIEDSRFYENNGLDLHGIARAALNNTSGGDLQGASTITQQLVKNSLLEQAHTPQQKAAVTADTIDRKLQEARYALRISRTMSKDSILEAYLNIAYFGNGAYGVQAAAETYFGTNARDLSLPQAALLAGLVRSPSGFDPIAHPADALARRNTVLARMAELGKIGPLQQSMAEQMPLGLRPAPKSAGCYGSDTGYFCDWVLQQLLADPALGRTPEQRKDALYNDGLRIRTTLDRKVQAATVKAVVAARGSRAALATAVVQPGTGKVLAMAGSVPFGVAKGASSVNLPLGGSSGFQAGSTFKVFVLTQAIEKGLPLSFKLHAPQTYASKQFAKYNFVPGKGYQPYVVSNASDSEAGDFTLEEATWHSVNTYFLQLEERVGFDGPARIAESLGVRRADGKPLQRVPSFTLGVNEVSPLAMSAAYAAYAAHGRYCRPLGINSIARGRTWLSHATPSCKDVLDRRVADTVTHVLQGVVAKGTAAGSVHVRGDAAGKTGTVDNFSAAWFAGFTPQLSAAVWMGDPRGGFGHPLKSLTVAGRFYPRMYGGDLPAQTWSALVNGAETEGPHFQLQLPTPPPTATPTATPVGAPPSATPQH